MPFLYSTSIASLLTYLPFVLLLYFYSLSTFVPSLYSTSIAYLLTHIPFVPFLYSTSIVHPLYERGCNGASLQAMYQAATLPNLLVHVPSGNVAKSTRSKCFSSSSLKYSVNFIIYVLTTHFVPNYFFIFFFVLLHLPFHSLFGNLPFPLFFSINLIYFKLFLSSPIFPSFSPSPSSNSPNAPPPDCASITASPRQLIVFVPTRGSYTIAIHSLPTSAVTVINN